MSYYFDVGVETDNELMAMTEDKLRLERLRHDLAMRMEELACKIEEVDSQIKEAEKDNRFEPIAGDFISTCSGRILYMSQEDDLAQEGGKERVDRYQKWVSEEQAERYLKARTFHACLFQIAERLDEGRQHPSPYPSPHDWIEPNQEKYIIRFSYPLKKYTIEQWFQVCSLTPVFRSKEAAKQACKWLQNLYPEGPEL